MPKTKKEFYLKIIFLISLVAIISAYYIEFILGYQPCNLCLIERIPYALALIILIINFKFKKNEKFLILLLILIFFFSLLVSIYHFGIEQGFFQESLMCDVKNSDSILSKEELLLELQKDNQTTKLNKFTTKNVAVKDKNNNEYNIILNMFVFYKYGVNR